LPFALVLIGLIMIVTGARNTHAAFGQQVVSDFTGPGNFTTWIVAIGAVGAVGYIEPLRPLSRAFMTLIIISFIVKNGGVFNKLTQALNEGPLHTAENSQAATKDSSTTSGGIKVQDHTAEYVDDLRQSVQSGIAANAAASGNAQKNFGTTLKVATKIFGFL
jgi:hypothetical protein